MFVPFVFKYGEMNGGKSAKLLMTKHMYESTGKKVLIFKPSADTRDGQFVQSRALSEKVPAKIVTPKMMNWMYNEVKSYKPDVVLVDEAQFFQVHQIDELARIVDLLDVPVIAHGLMADFKTELFPASKRLVEVGATLEKIEAVCSDCANPTTFNMRLFNGKPIFEGEQVQVGGNESYKSVCRSCYLKAKARAMQLDVSNGLS